MILMDNETSFIHSRPTHTAGLVSKRGSQTQMLSWQDSEKDAAPSNENKPRSLKANFASLAFSTWWHQLRIHPAEDQLDAVRMEIVDKHESICISLGLGPYESSLPLFRVSVFHLFISLPFLCFMSRANCCL